ncbi:carbohydrate ABC transporter permease [Paenibacillus flagellatus]|uniref:Spermidine/putrescine ABC transporter permease n=1 Tax=Paenibacillus flagellatus TaxID=2211139 RepID=A0A2V5K0Q2_9BACL|nr:sugar ABC transporter permease [Paenibacillus flagellatus]PYI51033.1 spermidine/putrescine ABC transporter permease [Paenibacillus flagellatus]
MAEPRTASVPAYADSRTSRKTKFEKKLRLFGVLFALPWIAGLLLFHLYPLAASLYYSFTSYSILEPGQWVGLDNYRELLHDGTFRTSIYNTLYYTFLFVPLSIVFGVAIALVLNMKIRGQGVYRTLFFIPSLVPPVATTIIWLWLLNPQFGLVNYWLEQIGIPGPPWLGSEHWSKPSLILMSLWGIGQAIVIYLAGLQDVPQDYYDAAEVDGAGTLLRFRHITLPLITPVIFFNLIMGMIGALQNFALPYTLTNGKGTPANSMMFMVMYLYTNGFGYLKMGYASAMAWVLFLIVITLTAVLFATQRRWVFYQGKE